MQTIFDLTPQVLQKSHTASTHWSFTTDRVALHSNGQTDQNMRQMSPANLAASEKGRFHALLSLTPVPYTSPLGHFQHSSSVNNPEQNQSFFLCWVSELNQLTQIRISRSEPHKSELAGMSPFFFVNSELPCDTQKH